MKNNASQNEFVITRKRFQFFRLMGYFKPFIPLLLLAVLLALAMNGSILLKPYILKHVIDEFLVPGRFDIQGLRLMAVFFFLATAMGLLAMYAQSYLLTYIGQNIMFTIRNQLFKHIQNMSMGFFDRHSSGRLLTRVTNDVESLNELFSGVLINIFRDIILLIGIVGTMFAMNWRLALIAVSCVPVIAGITVVYRIAARKNFVKVKGMIARINGFLAENISGMKLVQIFHREKEKHDELSQLDREYFSYSLREVILNSLGRPVVDIINNLTVAVLIWYCTGRIMESTLEIGVLYAFITYIKQFFDPISEIAEKYTTIQSAIVSSERIFEILDNSENQEDMNVGKTVDTLSGEIEFKNVWFAYDNENWVLKDVSFKITPGETVAFVGATGSGKSTIISLMARFYDIQKGTILIDGIDIKEYQLKSLRRQIAVVLQDVFLFAGDIKSNIRLNNKNISDRDILNAARYVSADRFIDSLPKGYDDEVKERGCTFSAGQKQLISFARAVAFKPSILVLDEATANIDTETEMAIQEAMVNISKDRTSIIIAHRLSTIRNADKIMVIHKGRLKETGKHEELLDKKGLYAQLYQNQLVREKTATGA